MNKYSLFIIFLLLTGLSACRKDKLTTCNDPECYDFPNFNGITWFTFDRFQYKTPCFNPNNPNEFVYNELDYESKKYTLVKYNLLTSKKTMIADSVIVISQPKWSRKGWIAFDNVYGNTSYQISIIKDDGDSLRLFTSTKANIFPTWDATGENLYWHHSPVLGVPYYFLRHGLTSNTIDTVLQDGDPYHGYTAYSDISSKNNLVTKTYIGNQTHLGVSTGLNPVVFNSVINLEQEGHNGLEGLSWSDDNTTIYFSSVFGEKESGLYELNINTQSKKRLIKFCSSKYYTRISCSSDGTKLIGERVNQNLNPTPDGKPTGEIQKNSSIYLIDLNTLIETKIDLE